MNGSISEIMAQKKADALARVKTALWKDDPDAAADAALKGGVDPVTTDRIASEVQAAKSALAAAVTANAALPELTKSAAATRQAAAKTARALQLAQVANTEASDAAGDAGAAVEVARAPLTRRRGCCPVAKSLTPTLLILCGRSSRPGKRRRLNPSGRRLGRTWGVHPVSGIPYPDVGYRTETAAGSGPFETRGRGNIVRTCATARYPGWASAARHGATRRGAAAVAGAWLNEAAV